MVGFAYSNNGLSWRLVEADWALAAGEVYFASVPTSAEITSAFPEYASTVAAATLASQAIAALAGGLTITLSGSMTLAATLFPTDNETQAKIDAVVTTLLATSTFPGGATSYPMKDSSGSWHTFTETQYKAVAGAIAAYVAGLRLIADGNPNSAISLPTASVALTV